MKRLNIILLCSLLFAAGCTEKEPPFIASGTTGELTWKLLEDGTLTISGKGTMPDYVPTHSNETTSPWNEYRDEITGVIIGDNISSIGNFAFKGCSSLLSVTIPNSVKSIGPIAFGSCTVLTSVTIPSSVISVGNSVFHGCSNLTSIEVDSDNPILSSENGVLFNKAKTMLIEYPAGKIGGYTIPNSVAVIGDFAFQGRSGLTSVTIPGSVNRIGEYAFQACTWLTSVTIPNSVTSISFGAFSMTGITSVIIPNSITSLSNLLFSECRELKSVTIPNSVTYIGFEAFGGCTDLTEIINHRVIPQEITSGYIEGVCSVFRGVNKTLCTLFVSAGSEAAYCEAEVWEDFENIKTINAD